MVQTARDQSQASIWSRDLICISRDRKWPYLGMSLFTWPALSQSEASIWRSCDLICILGHAPFGSRDLICILGHASFGSRVASQPTRGLHLCIGASICVFWPRPTRDLTMWSIVYKQWAVVYNRRLIIFFFIFFVKKHIHKRASYTFHVGGRRIAVYF